MEIANNYLFLIVKELNNQIYFLNLIYIRIPTAAKAKNSVTNRSTISHPHSSKSSFSSTFDESVGCTF
jgi:hypothetical protein